MRIQKTMIMGLLAAVMTIGSISPAKAGGQSFLSGNEGLGFALAAVGGMAYMGATHSGRHALRGMIVPFAGAAAMAATQYLLPSYPSPQVYTAPTYYGASTYHGYQRYMR